jgi:uncharacterized protein (UPF0332 family)
MKPEDFLQTASDLIKSGSEADLRSAASRAYYAAFHACKELSSSVIVEEVETKQSKSTGSHEKIIRTLTSCVGIKDSANLNMETNKKCRILGKALKSAKSSRTFADYKINDAFEIARAQHTVLKCDDIVKEAYHLMNII